MTHWGDNYWGPNYWGSGYWGNEGTTYYKTITGALSFGGDIGYREPSSLDVRRGRTRDHEAYYPGW